MFNNSFFGRPLGHVVFNTDGTGGGGGSDDNSQDDDATGGGGGQDGLGDNTSEKRFSQEDFNRLASKERDRGGNAKIKEVLEKTGFENEEDLYAAITAHKEAEDAKKSDLEKAQSDNEKAQQRIGELEAENRTMQLRRDFEEKAEELELAFVSKKAARTAFSLLDREKVGKDGEGMEEAVKAMHEEHSYLFAEPDEDAEDIDARERGGSNKRELDDSRKKELEGRFRIRQR